MVSEKPKKTMEERLDAVLQVVGGHDDRLDHLDGAVDAAQKTGAAAFAVAKQAAEAVKRIAALSGGDEGDEEEQVPPLCPLVHDDLDEMVEALRDLVDWVARVYMRYPDHGLTQCWLWHPWVVTELWALHKTWNVFYGEGSNDRAVLDWHIRYRKPIAQEVTEGLKGCGLDRHTDPTLYPVPVVFGTDHVNGLATWYTSTAGGYAPPVPDMNLLGLAAQRKKDDEERASGKTKNKIPRI